MYSSCHGRCQYDFIMKNPPPYHQLVESLMFFGNSLIQNIMDFNFGTIQMSKLRHMATPLP